MLVALLSTLAACGGTSTEPAPPTIHYGEDICEFCGMIVTEEQFAAAYVTSVGHGHVFDDIGDMVQSHLKNPEDIAAFFVHDYESEEWIRAETAYFVHSGDLRTPMVSGLAAFASADRAEAFATQWAGDVMTFEELLTFYRESPPTPFLSGSVQEGSGPKIRVIDAWSRPSPIPAGNGVVYMMLMNEGDSDDALVSAETDVAEVVELHESKMEGDVMRMRPVPKIVVPARGSATLEPGGLHMMLINLKKELVPGEKVTVTLNFEKSGPMTAEAEIRELGEDMGQMEHKME